MIGVFAALPSMAERLRRPDWVRRLSLMAGSVGGRARDLVPIDAGDLLGRAVASLGGMPSGDFGDPHWQERFEALVAAVDASDMHVVGRLMTRQELLRSLRSRLLLTAAVDAAPEIAAGTVPAPVFITGPARSGTSILFELLALHPDLRAPTAAEGLHPVPLPGDGADPGVLGECEQELWADVQPEFQAMHELRSDLPVECITLTQGSFCGFHWSMLAPLEGWFPDPAVNYDYERRFLQVLGGGAGPTQWVLKTPAHIMLLPSLFEAFGDAWVVQTHRDPARTMPSTVSMTTTIQWLRSDDVDVDLIAQLVCELFTAALNASVDLRESGAVPAERFVDIHYTRLMSDPAATLGAACEQMGLRFTDDYAAAVGDYLAQKPKGKFGVHRYRPEDWGFTADGLRTAMAPYLDHFGVATEG